MSSGALTFQVFIEVSAGCRQRWRFDEHSLQPLRVEEVALPYPYAYGFIPCTAGADGDALDCYVLTSEALPPGSQVECVPAGVLLQMEGGIPDPKILALPAGGALDEPLENSAARLMDFITAIFAAFPDVELTFSGLEPAESAQERIHRSQTT